jgi:hypothetical protein
MQVSRVPAEVTAAGILAVVAAGMAEAVAIDRQPVIIMNR